ncbi:uncharacterized protein DUF4136 [Pseudacidovorax intermedius]|uniref:Uncharacterized protein DUF4136 n=1 Tax=Pseudacidovorax intermedius TaxID=433924 RepID=A0A370FMA0_9BURK|nr:DUF4136 domain-containing protein [Pseudacidovorax intermedius]RDI28295.1 uncharacterized protein DUF4136 [Pseudacidovorax intermedius]
MQRAVRFLGLAAMAAVAAGLAGCATSYVVDNNVQSYAKAPIPPGATYRFERLPSQQANDAAQTDLESLAEPSLAAAGLRRDDANARYAVQVSARSQLELSPWADPWFDGPGWGPGWGPRWGVGLGYGRPGWYGGGWWGPGALPPNQTWYGREVSIVMRSLPDRQVVYETHARNDGPYPDTRRILPVMFHAALQGFPNPPQAVRRVDVTVETKPQTITPAASAPQAGTPAPSAQPAAPARP